MGGGTSRQQYTEEFKEQVLAEVEQVGNYTWMAKRRKNGSVSSLPKSKVKRLEELEKRLKLVSTENERLKRLLAEKELAILRELRDKVNPR